MEYDSYVQPLYLNVLHGNFLGANSKKLDVFIESTKLALEKLTDRDFTQMYNSGWRELITASYLCGIKYIPDYISRIDKSLIPSKTCYAGQFHCFALARIDNADSVRILRSYLDLYLPVGDNFYDQQWAIGALQWLDTKHGTDYSKVYIENSDFWQGKYRGSQEITSLNPQAGIIHFQRVMEFVDFHFQDYANNC
jgi:Family of unknown function (DUF6000)